MFGRSRSRNVAFSLALVFILCAAPAGSVTYKGLSTGASAAVPTGIPPQPPRPEVLVLRVYFSNNAERDKLATELGADEVSTMGGFLTLWADRNTYNSIVARGFHVEIDEAASKQANNPVVFGRSVPDTFFGGYATVEEMQSFLDSKVTAYPTLAAKVDFGDSWCKAHPGVCTQPNSNNGYDLLALHITNQAIPGPKPVFWYDAGIHSREIATPEVAMRYINWLLDNYNTNPDAHWLVDYHDIWIVPMLNPDGHHIVEAGGSSPYYQRKNADKDDGCTVYPPSSSNQFGTDLNRNFPWQWGCCGGSSTAACAETYRGPSASSEDETLAVIARIRTLIPDQRGPLSTDPAPITSTGIIQNMHSYANLNLFPWGYTTTTAPNGAEMNNIGAHMSAANASPAGNGYQYCQPPSCLYAVDGDSVTWSYGELGAPSFTTELEGGTFFPAYSAVNTIYNNNQGMLTYLAKIARTPYLTTRGPDTGGITTSPMTVTQGTVSHLTGTINYAWTGNTYSQNVAAAEYYIDTPPWAGGTPTSMTPVDGSYNSPTEAAEAFIDTTTLTPGRHIVSVRGRGVNSYSGYQSWGVISAAWLTVQAPSATVTPAPSFTATATNTPTASPTHAPVVLNGHVTLQGRGTQPDPRQSVPLTLTLRLISGGPDSNYSTSTDTSGNFTLTVAAPGTFNYRVKNPQTLANSGGTTLTAGGNNVEVGLLREGDADNNNCVSSTDFNILRSTFGKAVGEPNYDPRADFTGDSVVNSNDFTIERNNFGQCGALPILDAPK